MILNETQYGRRADTDRQWNCGTVEATFDGCMDRQARFVQDFQMFQTEYWKLFAEMFRCKGDSEDLAWRGEFFGKQMRGGCLMYRYTQDEKLYTELKRAVEDLLSTEEPGGGFSTYTADKAFSGWDLWCRKYVLLGLLHFHEICREPALAARIETALTAHMDIIVAHVGPGDGQVPLERSSHYWGGLNSASLLEPTVRMYRLTGQKAYLSFARYIIDFLMNGPVNVFRCALENRQDPYQYPVRKAYEMMSCFEGLLEYYRLTGESRWKEAVIHFADRVYESEITLIGSAGCEEELFNHAAATQTDTDYTGVMQETCVTVTWMKLCHQLLTLTGESKYADRMEWAMYNALYGAVNNEKTHENGGGAFDSYSPLTAGRRGRLLAGGCRLAEKRWYGCCVAIGAAGLALPLLSAVNETATGLAMNFYESGRITADGWRLRVDTAYPVDGAVRLSVEAAPPIRRTLALRIPAFSGEATVLRVNGEILPSAQMAFSDGYAVIDRVWAVGDRVELTVDMIPRLLRPRGMDEKPQTKQFFAVTRGPLVMAREQRLGPVGQPVALGESWSLTPQASCPLPCLFCGELTVGDRRMTVIDYGSAGKTQTDESRLEAWIPTAADE